MEKLYEFVWLTLTTRVFLPEILENHKWICKKSGVCFNEGWQKNCLRVKVMLNGYNNPVMLTKLSMRDPKIVSFNMDLMHNQWKRIL